ncbi:hypothetical protein BMS3Bbin04_01349 [bacterium BMS3Bbin04]|nr:hypothetical protein BMS3Bbin04_01349 [bacterium BMS3Bbin04]
MFNGAPAGCASRDDLIMSAAFIIRDRPLFIVIDSAINRGLSLIINRGLSLITQTQKTDDKRRSMNISQRLTNLFASTRRPGHLASREKMHVQVEDLLSSVGIGVNDETIPLLSHANFCGDVARS